MNCWKDIADIINKLVTSIGIIIAGCWTYRLFIRQRTGQPKIKINQNIDKITLPKDKYLFHVSNVRLGNCYNHNIQQKLK